ncbi:hypothetical protein [Arthrobacter sp. H41]|uniref:hypothetical protein n=1 Tax=Arthrobacter sp. H41 TaxID=1312978 RepID=UPI0004BB3BF1|nr:hypothetical protein [Arthrobacter sp. H41]
MGRSATPTLVSTGALCLAFLLASCGSPEPDPAAQEAPSAAASTPAPPATTTAQPSSSASGNATTAPAPSAPPGTAPAPGLVTHTTSDGTLSFDHPGNWTAADNPGEAPLGGVSVVVSDATGRQLASLQTNLVTGSVCAEGMPYSIIDSEPLPALAQPSGTPTFRFESRSNPLATDPMSMVTFAYGITSAPAPTGPEACPISHFFTWPPSGAAFGGIYDPFDTSPGKPQHVDTPQAYAETEEYQKIRAMITSLHPAG